MRAFNSSMLGRGELVKGCSHTNFPWSSSSSSLSLSKGFVFTNCSRRLRPSSTSVPKKRWSLRGLSSSTRCILLSAKNSKSNADPTGMRFPRIKILPLITCSFLVIGSFSQAATASCGRYIFLRYRIMGSWSPRSEKYRKNGRASESFNS